MAYEFNKRYAYIKFLEGGQKDGLSYQLYTTAFFGGIDSCTLFLHPFLPIYSHICNMLYDILYSNDATSSAKFQVY